MGSSPGWRKEGTLDVGAEDVSARRLRGILQSFEKRVVTFGGPGDGRRQERGRTGLRQLASQLCQGLRVRSYLDVESAIYLEVDESGADMPEDLATLAWESIEARRAYDFEDLAATDNHRHPAQRFGGENVTDEGVRFHHASRGPVRSYRVQCPTHASGDDIQPLARFGCGRHPCLPHNNCHFDRPLSARSSSSASFFGALKVSRTMRHARCFSFSDPVFLVFRQRSSR